MRLSKAQMAFLDEWVPAQQIWAHACDLAIGAVPGNGQRRTFDALVRKDVITPGGQITKEGLTAWERAVARLKKRSA
ncbi:pyrroline-5-carboxylate reductase [Bradyrhizobium sp. AZCC 1610]|uniref:hypothetical protein n=1 Tax=Bradyrhizobium sp. AZCC 1610 TaxID=3117020 RepID=UPI002FF33A8B